MADDETTASASASAASASAASDPSAVFYAYATAVLVAVGLVVNVASFVLLSYRKKKTMFHTLLKLMAVYDLAVMLGCLCLYSLPDLWPDFARSAYPHFVANVLPVVQIAMMTSIYCTILMSFERYIRICHLCQLRSTKVLTDDNFWMYLVLVVVLPVLFYLPKFFEVSAAAAVREQRFLLNCTQMRTAAEAEDASEEERGSSDSAVPFSPLCLRFDFSSDPNDSLVRILRRKVEVLELRPTALREDPLYYRLYCIAANTAFASVVPLVSLIYLNIATVRALRQMGRSLKSPEGDDVSLRLAGAGSLSPCASGRLRARRQSHHLSLLNVATGYSGRRIEGSRPARSSPPPPGASTSTTTARLRRATTSVNVEATAADGGNSNTVVVNLRGGGARSAVAVVATINVADDEDGNAGCSGGIDAAASDKKKKSGSGGNRLTVNVMRRSSSSAEVEATATFGDDDDGEDADPVAAAASSEGASAVMPRSRSYAVDRPAASASGCKGPEYRPSDLLLSSRNDKMLGGGNDKADDSALSATQSAGTDDEDEEDTARRVTITEPVAEADAAAAASSEDDGGRQPQQDDLRGPRRALSGDDEGSKKRRRRRRRRRRAAAARRRMERWLQNGLTRRGGAGEGGGCAGASQWSLSPNNAAAGANSNPFSRHQSLRRRQGSVMRRQENRLTRISLSIVSLFVACHAWRLVPTLFEAYHAASDRTVVLRRWPEWLVHVNHLSHTLIVFNSAVNFLLYVVW